MTAEVWRCVFIAELCLARQKEEAGTLLFAQINDSFSNSHHCAEQSLLETQGEGEAVQDIHQHAGKGPRLCIVGAISQFGPLVCPDPHGTGYVRNYRWKNAKGESVSSGGEFVELDAEGQVGARYLKLRQQRKKLSYMSSAELDATAEHRDVQWESGTTTNVKRLPSL